MINLHTSHTLAAVVYIRNAPDRSVFQKNIEFRFVSIRYSFYSLSLTDSNADAFFIVSAYGGVLEGYKENNAPAIVPLRFIIVH